MFRQDLDKVASFYASGRYSSEFRKAREYYFSVTGAVFDDEPCFDERQELFVDWFVLDRPLEVTGFTPVRQFFESYRLEMDAAERARFEALLSSHRCLCEVISVSDGGMRIKSMFSGKTFDVIGTYEKLGIDKRDVLDVRLAPWGEGLRLCGRFTRHPRDARDMIADIVSSVSEGGDRIKVMLSLLGMQLKASKYRNVPIDKIYSINSLSS